MSKVDGSSIVKSGYLIKLATKSGKNWKKRYFMLNGNTLTYYTDHNSLDKAKGDLLITAEAVVEDTLIEGKPHCCSIVTPFHTLVIAAKDNNEMKAWKKAIQNSIVEARTSIRGYITKVGGFLEGKHRKFFILHTSAITWHSDHEHTSSIQGMMKLTASVVMTANDTDTKIELLERTSNTILSLSFEQNKHEYSSWKKGIGKVLERFEKAEEETLQRIENAYDAAVMRGKLKVRPAKGGDEWNEHYFVLTMQELLVLEKNKDSGQTEVVDLYEIFPSCSVFETNLGQFAFELVTPKKVLHVKSSSRDVTAAWIHNIRASIAASEPDLTDPILQLAITKMEEDVFYDVSFHEDKPLGVVLERSGEWAVVKLSSFRDTGVSIGSALSSVNGESCILQPYQFAIGQLKNWKPPLHLGFRQSPKKSGYLVKLSRQRKGGSHKNWKTRFFSLGEGRLVYKDDDSANSALKGDVPLMGSAVSLVSSSETGKFFCFRVVSGVTSLVMQGETQDEMMDWAATLYHAIAIANGGGHIINIERKRHKEELSFERRKLADLEAKHQQEEDRLAKLKAEEEAELAMRQAAEEAAATKRKAEEEAKRLLAEEEEARQEQERLMREEIDRRERKIEEANDMLQGAMEIEDAPTLETAIAAVETMDVVEQVKQLPLAKQMLLLILGDEEDAAAEEKRQEQTRLAAEQAAREVEEAAIRARAEEEAAAEAARLREAEEAARVAAEAAEAEALKDVAKKQLAEVTEALSTLIASASLSTQSLEQLHMVLTKAEALEGVDESLVEAARSKVAVLSQEAQNIEEVRSMLRSAMVSESVMSMEQALTFADSISYQGEEVGRAQLQLVQWREKEKEEQQREQARLEEETRRLDEELAAAGVISGSTSKDSDELSVVEEEGEDEDLDDLDDEEVEDTIKSPSAVGQGGGSFSDKISNFSGKGKDGRGALERRPSFTDSNRKLGTIKERLKEDARRAAEEDGSSITTDGQLGRFFQSYARVIDGFEHNEPLLTPVQFSSILRLVTGEKGNLFVEMKTFNKFDDDGSGYINQSEFVQGFKELAKSNAAMVDKISLLVGQDNVII